MGFSDAVNDAILDLVLGAVAYTPDDPVYIALYTVAPTSGGGGTEVTGGSYARVAVDNDKVTWSNAASGALANDILIDFGTATADWGTVVAFAVMDAASAGNQIGWGMLGAAKAVESGDGPVSFAVGDLVVTQGACP